MAADRSESKLLQTAARFGDSIRAHAFGFKTRELAVIPRASGHEALLPFL